MIDLINFYHLYAEPIAGVYGCLVALATIIIKATPSKKDDTIWGKIVKVLDFFSTAFTDSDKEKLNK